MILEPLYLIIDSHTGAVVGGALPIRRARAKRDRLDLKYGAVRYMLRPAD